MTNVYDAQLNLCAETTWGTYASSGARSVEFLSESLQGNYERVSSMGIKAGRKLLGELNTLPVAKGAAGSITLNPMTKGFGLLLDMALGTTSVGSASGGKYLKTSTMASLTTKSMSVQVYRPFAGPSTSGQTSTYTGTKVASWGISGAVDGLVAAEFGLVSKAVATGTALVSAAYPSTIEPFVWASTTVSLGGSTFYCTSFDVKGDNGLKTDRWKLGGTMDEQTEEKERSITGTLGGGEFTSSTISSYISASANASMYAAITITCLGQTDTANALTITIPKARIDAGLPNVSTGNLLIEQPVNFTVVAPSDGSEPFTITYNSTDSAV